MVGSVIVLLVLLIVWAVFSSSKVLDAMRARGRDATEASFAIGRHYQQGLMNLNRRVFALAVGGSVEEWARFESDWTNLTVWLEQQPLSTPEEQEVRLQMQAYGADYHQAAAAAAALAGDPQGGRALTAALLTLQERTAPLLDNASKLAFLHRVALRAQHNETMGALARLRGLLLGALGLLLILVVWLAATVHHQLIAPLQGRLVESQALLERQEKLASLGVLAAGVAHEIRNPLTAIKAWLFMHQRGLTPGTSEHADAEVIANELARLERIIRDFLDFARPSEPQLQMVPAERTLSEVRDLLVRPLSKLDIKLEVDPSQAGSIRVDPHQIKQVLINLVRNGAEAIGQGGAVTLRARTDRARLAGRESEVVVLEVSDTGRGIAPDVEKRLFDPFFSTKETGTGLGLSIAARIVEKHGGLLRYHTEINRGTTFGVVLLRSE